VDPADRAVGDVADGEVEVELVEEAADGEHGSGRVEPRVEATTRP
jgi:hypothetical protein